MRLYFAIASFLVFLGVLGCNNGDTKKNSKVVFQTAKEKDNEMKLDKLNHDYFEIPDEKLLDNNGAASPLYAELVERYKSNLSELKKSVEATGAKLVVVIIKPVEDREYVVKNFKAGRPQILNVCANLGLDCYDLSNDIDAQDARVVTLMPNDGHWSKKGSIFLASKLMPIFKKYTNIKSTAVYKDTERPETFGDLSPNDDEFLDGGKDLPYHLKANAQGLRMDYDVKFPKTKPRFLFLGSSHIFSPFLDNEFIMTSVLQKQMPEIEILNAASISYSMDDYVSLFNEKAKYAEPDVVFVQTNGGDIIHLYFSNRNHVSRNKIPRYPTQLEEAYYNQNYKK